MSIIYLIINKEVIMEQRKREMRVKEVEPAKSSYEVIEVKKEEPKQKCEDDGHTNLEEVGCLQEVMERY